MLQPDDTDPSPILTVPCERAPAPRDGGFTLIELMVVMLVVLVLFAIISPSLGVARWFPAMREATSTAQTVSEAVWAFQRDHQGRVPANPSDASEWLPDSGPIDRDGKPYTGRPALSNYRGTTVQVCFAAAGTSGPNGGTCSSAATNATSLARVVYRPINGATGAPDGYLVEVYGRRNSKNSFGISDLKCSIGRASTGAAESTC